MNIEAYDAESLRKLVRLLEYENRLLKEKLKKENAALAEEKQNLGDLKYIEKVARDEHNMVGKNEIPLFMVKNNQGSK